MTIAAAAGALVVGVAVPGSAGGAGRTTYPASGLFAGAVQSSLGSLDLADYTSGQYTDRILGGPTRKESVIVNSTTCKDSQLGFYGRSYDWANVASGVPQGARMRLSCTYPDGSRHRFYWGVVSNGDGTFSNTTNCLALVRNNSTYTVTTPTG